jgi:hypothetical protein
MNEFRWDAPSKFYRPPQSRKIDCGRETPAGLKTKAKRDD